MTTDSKPFAERQRELLTSQTFRPQMVNEYAEPGPAIVKTSRVGWWIWPAALVLGFAVVIGIASI